MSLASTVLTRRAGPHKDHSCGMAPHVVVVFPLTTTITISSLPTPMPTALEDYLPSYNARPDGSLITSEYMREIQDANVRLFFIGFFLMLFIRNTIVSVDYLYRSRAKDKTLFYLLVASQVLGPVCFIGMAASWLSAKVDCTAVYTVTLIAITVSETLLITGILGIKAYRCLDRSRVVLVVLTLLQVASTGLLFFDVSRVRSHRTAAGYCDIAREFNICPLSVLALFLQSFFICSCFLYTVWKASPYAAAQGRLSLAGTLDTVGDESDGPISPAAPDPPERRGWWDYVPERRDPVEPQRNTPDNQSVFSHISRIFVPPPEPRTPIPQRKLSLRLDHPLPQPPPPLPHPPEKSRTSLAQTGRGSPPQRRGKLSRIRFVRVALRDELFHTAAVAVNSILTVILIVVGFFKLNFLWSPMVWLGVNWMMTSLIVMHSFSQVVRRHEREAILQEPNTWESMVVRARRRHTWRSTSSPTSIPSERRSRRRAESDSQSGSRSFDNPFRGSDDIDVPRIARRASAESLDTWNAEPSPPPVSSLEFLPNHYPERVVAQPLEPPTDDL